MTKLRSLIGALLMATLAAIAVGDEAPAPEKPLAELLWRSGSGATPVYDARSSCGGIYVDPAFPFAEGIVPADEFEVIAEGSDVEYLEDQSVSISGPVEVRQGNRMIRAQGASLDMGTGAARFHGATELTEPGIHMRGMDAVIADEGDSVHIGDMEFVMTATAMRGTAAAFDRSGPLRTFDRATLTGCPPGNRIWRLSARRIRIREGETFANARGVRFDVLGVPVMYSPWAQFPASDQRTSGFLFPTLRTHGREGNDLTLPYYWNLAPNLDATIAPRSISRRGPGADIELRHISTVSAAHLMGTYIRRDELYNGITDILRYKAEEPFVPADRWFISTRQGMRWRGLSTQVDFTSVSDNDFFIDMGSGFGERTAESLEQRVSIGYELGDFSATVWAQRFQALVRNYSYRRQPEVLLSYAPKRTRIASVPIEWSIRSVWSRFSHPRANVVTGERSHAEASMALPLDASWGWAHADATVLHTRYELDLDEDPEAPPLARTIPMLQMDMGLRIERDIALPGKSKSSGSRSMPWLWGITPRAQYRHTPYRDQDDLPFFDGGRHRLDYQNLFRNKRFSGFDRISDTHEVAVGIESSLFAPASGQALLTTRVGTIIPLDDDRKVAAEPHLDPLEEDGAMAAELTVQTRRWRFDANWLARPEQEDSDQWHVGGQYASASGGLINIGYRRREQQQIDQSDIAVFWPVLRRWNVFGRWHHDWDEGRLSERFAGFEFKDCCFSVALLWFWNAERPRNVSPPVTIVDRRIILQIVFDGLGGVGTKLRRHLIRGIRGYPDDQSSNSLTAHDFY